MCEMIACAFVCVKMFESTAPLICGSVVVIVVFAQNEASAIVTWTSTGTAFGILDNAAFGQDVLSSYFKRESST